MPLTNFEAHQLLKDSDWPAAAIAAKTRITDEDLADFIKTGVPMHPLQQGALMAWLELNVGISSTGKHVLTVYRPDVKMGAEVIAPDVMKMPRGAPFNPFASPPVLKVIDEDETAANLAGVLHGGMTGSAVNVTADNIKAGKQVVKRGSKAA